jgi:hypothetical protein
MGDGCAADLTLDLTPTVPTAVLDDLRFHLGVLDAGSDVDQEDAGGEGDLIALLPGRGPTTRIGGVRTGELVRARDGWALTARQGRAPRVSA